MRAINVKLGETYLVKVSDNIAPVRLDRKAMDTQNAAGQWRSGGWWGTNLKTGREVRIRSAARLRCLAPISP